MGSLGNTPWKLKVLDSSSHGVEDLRLVAWVETLRLHVPL